MDGVDVGWTNLKPWIWVWVVAELVSPSTLLHPHHQGQFYCAAQAWSGTSTPALTPLGPVFCPGEGWGQFSGTAQMRGGAGFQCSCPLGQFCCAVQARVGPTLHSPQTLSLPQVAAQTRDISMAFGGKMSHGHGPRQGSQSRHGPGPHHGFRWQCRLFLGLISPVLPLFTVYKWSHFFLSRLPTTRLLLIVVPALPVPCGGRWGSLGCLLLCPCHVEVGKQANIFQDF